MEDLVRGFSEVIKRQLRSMHREFFKDSFPEHLLVLYSKSKLGLDETHIDDHHESIRKAFEELNKLTWIEPILKIVSTSRKLKIVFDFSRNSVEYLDPTKHRGVLGTTYPNQAYIYIGAMELLTEGESRKQVLATLVHEMCHFAMEIMYNNECNPYLVNDKGKYEVFNAIFKETERRKNFDDLVVRVYDKMPEEVQHSELIVCIPHLIVLFHSDKERLRKMTKVLSKLFNFYKKTILIDFIQNYTVIKAKNEIRAVNEIIGMLSELKTSDIKFSGNGLKIDSIGDHEIFFISSNCPKLTIQAIYQYVQEKFDFESAYMFVDIRIIKLKKFFDSAVNALKLSTKLKLLINCDRHINSNEILRIVDNLHERKIKQRVIFVHDKSLESIEMRHQKLDINHTWGELTKKSQEKLLNKRIYFQEYEMKIGDLVKDFKLLHSFPFNELLDDQKISVGENLGKTNSDKYIGKKILSSTSKQFQNWSGEHDFSKLPEFAGKNQTIWIFDDLEKEKPSTLQILKAMLKEKYPSHWIVFMDLKQICKDYFIKNEMNFKDCNEIISFLSDEILKIQSFEAHIFAHLFTDDQVIFLFDGLDEVNINLKNFVSELIYAIQVLSRNQLWISTRLGQPKKPKTFGFKPISEGNKMKNCLMNFIVSKIQEFKENLEEILGFFVH